MKNLFARFIREEEGQDLVEYAFLVVFIALAVSFSLDYFAEQLDTFYSAIGDALPDSAPLVATPGV
jgi:Flp pilus assembly pilin Flp